MSHSYTFCALNKKGEFDVFAKIRDNTPDLGNTNLIFMAPISLTTAEKMLAIMAENGLLTKCEGEDGMYTLTEKGLQMDREAKHKMLEDGGCYESL